MNRFNPHINYARICDIADGQGCGNTVETLYCQCQQRFHDLPLIVNMLSTLGIATVRLIEHRTPIPFRISRFLPSKAKRTAYLEPALLLILSTESPSSYTRIPFLIE